MHGHAQGVSGQQHNGQLASLHEPRFLRHLGRLTHPSQHTHSWLHSCASCLPRATFRTLLANGEKDIIYTILKWVVPQPQELQKRAFVGYYLSFPEVCALASKG